MNIKCLLTIAACFVLFSHDTIHAGTVTKTQTTPCPGGGVATHTLVYDADDGRLLSASQVLCSGASKTTTYSCVEELISTFFPSGGAISMAGSNFEVTIASTVEIVSITSASVVYLYPGTVATNTPTAIWGSLGTGVFLLVARHPSSYSTVYATQVFFNP